MTYPAIIPARGGSVRLPGKNLFKLGSRTLIELAVDSAAGVVGLDNVYVTTEDPEIAAEALRVGAQHIQRPAEFATSSATAKSVAVHAVNEIQARMGRDFEAFIYLQPTSPLRRADDVQACVDMFAEHDCNTVISMTESEVVPGRFWALRDGTMEPYFETADPFTRRQDQSVAFRPNGAVYVCRTQSFLDGPSNSFLIEPAYGYDMPETRSIDIDTRDDFILAQVWMERADDL